MEQKCCLAIMLLRWQKLFRVLVSHAAGFYVRKFLVQPMQHLLPLQKKKTSHSIDILILTLINMATVKASKHIMLSQLYPVSSSYCLTCVHAIYSILMVLRFWSVSEFILTYKQSLSRLAHIPHGLISLLGGTETWLVLLLKGAHKKSCCIVLCQWASFLLGEIKRQASPATAPHHHPSSSHPALVFGSLSRIPAWTSLSYHWTPSHLPGDTHTYTRAHTHTHLCPPLSPASRCRAVCFLLRSHTSMRLALAEHGLTQLPQRTFLHFHTNSIVVASALSHLLRFNHT